MSRTMKAALCLGAGVGLWRMVDLFLFTDAATGFSAGSALWRYGVMALCALAAWAAALPAGQDAEAVPCGPAPLCGVFGAVCLCFGLWAPVCLALYGPQLSGHHVTARRELLSALGLCARGVWFFALGAVCLLAAWRASTRQGEALPGLGAGTAASGALYLHTVLRFIEAPASLHHVQPTVEVTGAVCAVMFFTALLRAGSPEGARARSVCRTGLLAFYFCTCWGVPQLVWQLCTGAAGKTPVLIGLALAVLGLWGAVAAYSPTVRTKQTL